MPTEPLFALWHHIAEAQKCAMQQRREIAACVAAGVYPAAPAEEWATLASGTKVLRLRFPKRGGRYLSPHGARRLYVGADPSAIAEARATVARTVRYQRLITEAAALQAWLDQFAQRLAPLISEAAAWPRAMTHEEGEG